MTSLTLLFADLLSAQNQAIELGKVHWIRSIQTAQRHAKSSGKPILILFQEVPGCLTCQNYGSEVLSHPLMVEAIESYFVPLAIFNNKGGSDREVLEIFKEPSWNNPVVRIVSHDLTEWTNRLSSNYSSLGLIEKINTTILKTKGKIPEWLQLLEEEFKSQNREIDKVYIGMPCFWSGEKHYGALVGVMATRAGFMAGAEVVEVQFDPSKISLEKLIENGQAFGQANKIFLPTNQKIFMNSIIVKPISEFKADTESKYYIYNSLYRFLPMTRLQSSRTNSLLGNLQCPDQILSPRQIHLLEKIKQNPSKYKHHCIEQDIQEAWRNLIP
ncbi:MAG: thioredoxin family protein [Saprospiraceae bacterium]|nr:thioredoxin family protein [Saprospiraceae bacterium]MBK7810549.1 thioredoxin family protein [Saprospiraceae bacterium]